MKNLILKKLLAAASILLSVQCLAQPAVEYSYDNAGNRIQRKVIPSGMIIGDLGMSEREDLKSVAGEFEFSVLPNPTNSIVKIRAEQTFLDLEQRELSVYDMKGNLIVKRPFNNMEEVIDLTYQATGSYIVKLQASGGIYSEWRVIRE